MKDRLVAGGLAGLIGGAVQNIFSIIAKNLGWAEHTFSEYAIVVLTHRLYNNFVGSIIGFIAYLVVGIFFGIIFAYIISYTSSKYLYIKSLIYSAVLWFLLSGFGTIFKMPAFTNLSANSALITLISGFVYGSIVAYILDYLDANTNLL